MWCCVLLTSFPFTWLRHVFRSHNFIRAVAAWPAAAIPIEVEQTVVLTTYRGQKPKGDRGRKRSCQQSSLSVEEKHAARTTLCWPTVSNFDFYYMQLVLSNPCLAMACTPYLPLSRSSSVRLQCNRARAVEASACNRGASSHRVQSGGLFPPRAIGGPLPTACNRFNIIN